MSFHLKQAEVEVKCDRPPSRFVRRLDIVKIDTEMLKKESREAFLETDYYRFYHAIDTPHSSIHQRIGCEMDNVATAAYDLVRFPNLYFGSRLGAQYPKNSKIFL